MGNRFNSMQYSEVLPAFFERKEHFSKEEYYNEMISICPEFKKKWYERVPSEKDIQKMIIEDIGDMVVDGKESVPEAEKKLGIKIDPGYKYPKGMTDIEYHYDIFCKYGLFSIFQKSEKGRERCFDGKIVISKGTLETVTANKPNKRKAYRQAWINLHYPDRAAVKKSMQNDWNELCELNPELKEIKFDREDMALLGMARAGVTYGFPKEDIALFLNEHYKGNTGFEHRDRIKNESRDAGLPADFSFGWVPSSGTIKKIGELYKAVQKEKTEEKQTAPNIPARFCSAKVIEKGRTRFSEAERQTQNVSSQVATVMLSGKKLQR